MAQTKLIAGLASLLTLSSFLFAQDTSGDRDTTQHSVRFVMVDDNVNLEVLDWGGSGRGVILLHGGNRTAHDFDEFAQRLAGSYHVYGITRRGAGASSAPPPTETNYRADRLGDDVLAVMESLGLNRPVLVGHSLGGQELSSIGSRHPDKVAGLIYLDAGYQYAYYDRSKGSINIEVNEVRRKLEQLEPGKGPLDLKALINELLETNLPELERTLRQIQESLRNAPPPQASAQVLPQTRPIDAALRNGGQRYTDIRAPALAIYAFEPLPKPDGSRAPRIVE